jgi:mlo protein
LFALCVYFAELMILGFISLLLTIGQNYIVRICISEKVADKMLPCPLKNISDNKESSSDEVRHLRKLVSYERRYLSSDTTSYKCSRKVIAFTFFFFLHFGMTMKLTELL